MRPVPVVLRPIAFTLQLSVREGKIATHGQYASFKNHSFLSTDRTRPRQRQRALASRSRRARRIHREGLTLYATKTYIYAFSRTDSRRPSTCPFECGRNAFRICIDVKIHRHRRQSSVSSRRTRALQALFRVTPIAVVVIVVASARTRTVGIACATCYGANQKNQYPFLSYPWLLIAFATASVCVRASRSHPSRADASPRARRADILRIALLCVFFSYCISVSPISCPCTLSRMQGTLRPVTTGGMNPHHLARDRLVVRWDAAAENSVRSARVRVVSRRARAA